ncbi:MAG: LysR substrate-binding domain-containing protein [Hyphomicrobiales bacterium]
MRHAQLKAFHAVAQCGGFSKAARKLGLSQPAISDHVRNLEELYGVQLFVRDGRSVRLTALGRDLSALAERQFEVEGAAVSLLSAAKALETGRLVFAADAAVHILPLIARFRERHPNIAFELKTGNSGQALALLDGFHADFAVVGEEPQSLDYVKHLLRRDPLVAFVARDHRLSARRRIALRDLCAAGLVVRETGSVTRRMIDEEAAARGIALEESFEVEGREAVREAVAAGLGAGIVSRSEFVDDPRLRMIAISDWDGTMSEWLVCLQARRHLHIMDAFLALAVDVEPAAG